MGKEAVKDVGAVSDESCSMAVIRSAPLDVQESTFLVEKRINGI